MWTEINIENKRKRRRERKGERIKRSTERKGKARERKTMRNEEKKKIGRKKECDEGRKERYRETRT